MPKPRNNLWVVAAALGGVVYPPLVYLSHRLAPPSLLVAFGLALILLRLGKARSRLDAGVLSAALITAGIGLTGLLLLDAPLAERAYPVAISLAFAVAFGSSLIWPPSMIERIVLLTEASLPPAGIAYARKVTLVWTAFLLANAAVAGALGLWGSLRLWTLWTGLVSYLLMGALFLGEMAIRRLVRPRDVAVP